MGNIHHVVASQMIMASKTGQTQIRPFENVTGSTETIAIRNFTTSLKRRHHSIESLIRMRKIQSYKIASFPQTACS